LRENFAQICRKLGLDPDEYRILYDPLTWPDDLIPIPAERPGDFEQIPEQLLTQPEQESLSVEFEIDFAWAKRRRQRVRCSDA
jgi:hypothetical protein